MKQVIDIHTHTLMSGHAYGTIREMAQAAQERGLQVLGFAEHGPGMPGTCHPFYYLNLRAIPRRLYGVEIVHGCEVNVLNDGTLSLEQQYLKLLDYAIVGIHGTCYESQDAETNTDNLISCMRDEKVFFVSHPDSDEYPLNYERLVDAAKQYHVALEVNNSSFRKPHVRINCCENYRHMLALCRDKQVPIYIGSDAHDPSEVGEFALAEAFLAEEDFPEELILSLDKERFYAFIGMDQSCFR